MNKKDVKNILVDYLIIPEGQLPNSMLGLIRLKNLGEKEHPWEGVGMDLKSEHDRLKSDYFDLIKEIERIKEFIGMDTLN